MIDNYDAVLHRVSEVLGDERRATEWLEKMSGTLGHKPKDLLSTQEGINQVLRHIRSVELALDTD